MGLYILRPIEVDNDDLNPWEPWYDKYFGMVIRADNEKEARELAVEEDGMNFKGVNVWDSNLYTTCIVLENNGEKGLIIEDFASA